VKLYYAGDVHGSEKCWRKFLNAAKFYEADTLIMGGDITGKMMVPIVETADGRHEARVLGKHEIVSSGELEDMEKRIRFNGFYPYRCDRAEYERMNADTDYREETFTRLMTDEVRRWIALAEERLAAEYVERERAELRERLDTARPARLSRDEEHRPKARARGRVCNDGRLDEPHGHGVRLGRRDPAHRVRTALAATVAGASWRRPRVVAGRARAVRATRPRPRRQGNPADLERIRACADALVKDP